MDSKTIFIQHYTRYMNPLERELFLQSVNIIPCTCGAKDCLGWKMQGDFGLPF